MERREFLKQSSAAAVLAAASTSVKAAGKKAASSKPNVIFILADDMGYSDIGCFGAEVETPNLNKLAAGGMRISQFYNNPRCCPSRASIMTGLYSQQAGFGMMADDYGRYPWPQYKGDLLPNTVTLAEALKPAGYQTGAVGKWHLAAQRLDVGNHSWPLQRGFDKFYGTIAGANSYYNPETLVDGNDHIPAPMEKSYYYTDDVANHCAKFVKEFSANKKPYFIYCAFTCCHWPMQAFEEDIQKYAKRYEQGWDRLREERHAKQIAEGLLDPKWKLTPRDPRVPAWEKASFKDWEMRRMAVYAAMIERMDKGIGRIVDAVNESGQADNTLIIFMTDNGGNAEEFGQPADPWKKAEKRPIFIPIMTRDGSSTVQVGDDPRIMPGPENTYQALGIPWGNAANTPFREYKHFAHEGGISAPFIAHWPKVIAPTLKPLNAVGHETDIMPTLLELAGATYPKAVKAGPIPPMAGQSLVPLLEGKSRVRNTIYWEHEGNKAVRDGKWKLVAAYPDVWELYDMEADRTELHDLSKAMPERAKKMSDMWDAWAKEIGVQPWPMPQTPEGQRNRPKTPEYLLHDLPGAKS